MDSASHPPDVTLGLHSRLDLRVGRRENIASFFYYFVATAPSALSALSAFILAWGARV